MKTLTIITGAPCSGKSLLADRLAKSIADMKNIVKIAGITRPKMKELAKEQFSGSVVIIEMMFLSDIRLLVQDIDFYKLVMYRHVIITTQDYFDMSQLYADPFANNKRPLDFLVQRIVTSFNQPGQTD